MNFLRKYLIILSLMAFCPMFSLQYQLPKVLFLSTGDGEGNGTISDGLVIANEVFANLGAIVRIENRKILHNPQLMEQYSIIIAPTIYGYHDGDRLYSLSYLSEIEMQNIDNWVKNGGTLVSDVYLGRNMLAGQDRISREGDFNNENWSLSQCFGVEMKEMNMINYSIEATKIWNGTIVPMFNKDEWTPVITKITSSEIDTIAEWTSSKGKFPALTVNKYFSGNAVLLGNFSMIHPAIDNGFSNSIEIGDFYKYVYDLSLKNATHKIKLAVWEKGANSALCLTFNANGNKEQYERILDFTTKEKIPATFFVNSGIDKEIIQKISLNQIHELASGSYRRIDYRTLDYSQTITELLISENIFNSKSQGFRFPFTNNSFWGMFSLNELDFAYDSSIGVNHIEFYNGSVFPYNIPIFKDNFYQTLDILEISPNLHDDWFYLKSIDSKDYDNKEMNSDILKYDTYLKNSWERAIKANNGLMTVIAHPAYSGFNNETLTIIKNTVNRAKQDKAWITTLDSVAKRWNQFYNLSILIIENNNSVELTFSQKQTSTINNLSFILDKKPSNIIFTNSFTIDSLGDTFLLNLSTVTDNDKVIITY
ncbi:MAG: beta-galactosidase trimerization domain-containing protein [Candidatus Cloacimonetes bacterium]|nr:beta-galactosidase trimerization domain-containing protein [Candidatus Cloacimonadota bacterium]